MWLLHSTAHSTSIKYPMYEVLCSVFYALMLDYDLVLVDTIYAGCYAGVYTSLAIMLNIA